MATKIGTYELENKELGFSGYLCVRSVYNDMAFGGCRFSKNVTRAEVEELAYCMDLKLAAHGHPVGGAKGGLRISPDSPLLKQSIAEYGKAMKDILKTTVVLGKDMGATNESMDWLYASLSIPQLHVVKKGPDAARVPDRIRDMNGYQSHMTGLGVITAAARACGGLTGKYALIQGCGAVGIGAAMRLTDMGGKLKGISDVEFCVSHDNHISMSDLSQIVSNGRIDAVKAEKMGFQCAPSAELFKKEADLLILAASSHSLSADHARGMGAEVLIEGSNFGLVPDARQILFKRQIKVVPDVIASSSSAAMVAHQMASRNGYSHQQLWNKILPAIEQAVDQSMARSKSEGVDMRDAYIQIHTGERRNAG